MGEKYAKLGVCGVSPTSWELSWIFCCHLPTKNDPNTQIQRLIKDHDFFPPSIQFSLIHSQTTRTWNRVEAEMKNVKTTPSVNHPGSLVKRKPYHSVITNDIFLKSVICCHIHRKCTKIKNTTKIRSLLWKLVKRNFRETIYSLLWKKKTQNFTPNLIHITEYKVIIS